jgi:hypothetical protein
MAVKQTGNRAPECAGAVAMNDSHLAQTRKRGFIKKLVDCINGFVSRLSNHVQL